MPRRKYKKYGFGSKKFWGRAQGAVGVAGGVASAAFSALRIAQGVASLINAEWKVKDLDSSTTPDTSGSVIPLTFLAQGDTNGTRTGNSILPKLLSVRVRAILHASATASVVRVIIFRDKNYDGANPAVNEVLEITGNENYLSFRNLDFSDRFVIYKDWTLNLDEADTIDKTRSANIKFNTPAKGTRRKKWIHIEYDDTSAAQASSKENQLLMLVLSNEATNTPTVHYKTRFRYLDN